MTFRINLFDFTAHYHVSDEMKDSIWRFLNSEGKSCYLEELYEQFLSRHSTNRATLTSKLEDKTEFDRYREMIRQLYEISDIVDNPSEYNFVNRRNWYYFLRDFTRDGFYSKGVILNTPITLDYSIAEHRPIFRKIFSEILIQTEFPYEFLDYHACETFTSAKEWDKFIKVVYADFPDHSRKALLQDHQSLVRSDRKNKYREFSQFLTRSYVDDAGTLSDDASKLFDQLVEVYSGKQCMVQTQMIFALQKLKVIKVDGGTRADLYRALKLVFKLTDSDKAFYANFNALNKDDHHRKPEVNDHCTKIKNMLSMKSA